MNLFGTKFIDQISNNYLFVMGATFLFRSSFLIRYYLVIEQTINFILCVLRIKIQSLLTYNTYKLDVITSQLLL